MNRGRSQNSGRGYYNQRGRSSRSTSNISTSPHSPFVSDGNSADTHLGQRDNVSHPQRQTSGQRPSHSNSNQGPSPNVKDISSDIRNLNLVQNSPASVVHHSKHLGDASTFSSKFNKDFSQSDPTDKQPHQRKYVIDTSCVKDDDYSLPAVHAIGEMPSKKETEFSQTSHEKTDNSGISGNSDGPRPKVPFDICEEKTGSVVKLKAPLLVKNREKRKEISRAIEGYKVSILKPGMILLKNYISSADQVKIVKKCRAIGLGEGGFYQPGYRDGAELHLKMMCLGKNWDPKTSCYSELRSFDRARPPTIPNEFHQLVKGAIQDSHEYLRKHSKERNIEYILPSMSPNLCIVNFYAKSGRLGLHQDKDESPESIRRRLPVVSFSIGDSAEFLYSEQRDVEKADKVILESGDVLIFGGQSRLIFHGVKTILGDTAPKALREESNLCPGRLNLTFREY